MTDVARHLHTEIDAELDQLRTSADPGTVAVTRQKVSRWEIAVGR